MSHSPADELVPSYGRLIGLVLEAAASSEAVDYYNLKSEDPAHVAAWTWLKSEQRCAFLALVRYVQAHGDQLSEGIAADSPVEVPLQPPPKLLRRGDLSRARFVFLSRYAVKAEQAAAVVDQMAEDDLLARRLAYERRPTESHHLTERQIWRAGTEEWRGTMRREARRLRDALIHRLAIDTNGRSAEEDASGATSPLGGPKN
jgi:hypothetical protein